MAIHTLGLLRELSKNVTIDVVTGTKNPNVEGVASIHFASPLVPVWLLNILCKLRIQRLWHFFIFPDESIFWFPLALKRSINLIRKQKYDAIIVFTMPYGAALIGIFLKKLFKIPLIIKLDDSPSCVDAHSTYQSRIHHRLFSSYEDCMVRCADRVVYVSNLDMKRVMSRQPERLQNKFRLIRCAATPPQSIGDAVDNNRFEITYTGGMTGWMSFYRSKPNFISKLIRRFNGFGQYEAGAIDYRSHSPVYIGLAVKKLIAENAQWAGKVKVVVYGCSYSRHIIDDVLKTQGITDVVEVHGVVENSKSLAIMRKGTMLLVALPRKVEDSLATTISCKTYEYLTTDRPILAAVSKGECWDYLAGKPGVWLTLPSDIENMKNILQPLVREHLTGNIPRFDRSKLYYDVSYEHRAKQFFNLILELKKDSQLR